MENISWKVWRISQTSGGPKKGAHKGDVWECSNIGGLVRRNGVILPQHPQQGDLWNSYMVLDCGYKVHSIIANTWVENPDPEHYRFIDHIDGNKQNNDASNLRWCTQSMNINNPITLKRISESKKLYKFTDEHKKNIALSNKRSDDLMTPKQRKIRHTYNIKGICLKLNKDKTGYEYWSAKTNGHKLTEQEVDEILISQGFDTNGFRPKKKSRKLHWRINPETNKREYYE